VVARKDGSVASFEAEEVDEDIVGKLPGETDVSVSEKIGIHVLPE